jgi:hypothetical protein
MESLSPQPQLLKRKVSPRNHNCIKTKKKSGKGYGNGPEENLMTVYRPGIYPVNLTGHVEVYPCLVFQRLFLSMVTGVKIKGSAPGICMSQLKVLIFAGK